MATRTHPLFLKRGGFQAIPPEDRKMERDRERERKRKKRKKDRDIERKREREEEERCGEKRD